MTTKLIAKPAAPVTTGADSGETLEQILAKLDAFKAREGQPLLDRLSVLEAEAEEIRNTLQKMRVPVPPRITVEVTDEHINNTLLALYKVPKNGGMSISALEEVTGYKNSRMKGIRARLETAPASIKYTEKGTGRFVSLTDDGLEEAKAAAGTEEGKAYLAELDAKIAESKANKA